MSLTVFLVAGEPSGDRLGAALMAGLKTLRPDVTFMGIGGSEMQAEGLTSMFPMSELSVMGIAEILPRLMPLLARVRETAATIVAKSPNVLITIDSPDFCLRVARKVKAVSDIPTVHYVAPTVWAWRPKRAQKMARSIDHVLALFPFEPPYMTDAGVSCDFVGHPVTTEPVADVAERAEFRAQYAIAQTDPVVLVLPGSRGGEISRLMPVFGPSLQRVREQVPGAQFVIPAAEPVAQAVMEWAATLPFVVHILDPRGMERDQAAAQKRAAFGAADVALAASGTVSLELAASGTPMVIAYDMNWLTRRLIAAMLRVDTVTLVNLVSDTRVVPEFLAEDCVPEKIAPAIVALLTDPAAQAAQHQAAELTMKLLGRDAEPPGLRAARSVLAKINA